jgi:hypothetical protein
MDETEVMSGSESLRPEDTDHKPRDPSPANSAPRPFVYALGRIEPRFPSLGVEKEFFQATGRSDVAGLTDREALQSILSVRANRYLARQLCWVFVIQGLDTYLLTPRDSADLELLVEAVRPRPEPSDLDVAIGIRGPLAPPEVCNGLGVPVVVFDQLYSFDRGALLEAIPRPAKLSDKEFERFKATAAQLLDQILQMTDNSGGSDQHRALNYLVVRYPAIYAQTAEAHAGNAALSAVDVRPSRLSGVRAIVDVIFSYTHRQTDVTDEYLVRVDVTEEFPFLVSKLSPYYQH